MKISEKLNQSKVSVSLEVFPPKEDSAFEGVERAVDALSVYKPDFISVTYGAGGGTSQNTVKIASRIQNELGTTALAHLSCVSSSKDEIVELIGELKQNNISNILALRGDIPQGQSFPQAGRYKYAYQLVEEIKSQGDFCIGAACYPEGHVECANKDEDICRLKEKVDSGVDFLVTQMFFDNNVLYSFLYRALAHNIKIPVIAGIMPITSAKQIKRSCELSGASLSPRFKAIIDKFSDNPEALKQAGIAYATEQIIDLIANGVKGIHIYTMNRPEVTGKIMENISEIIKS